jgi:hypothetical protein
MILILWPLILGLSLLFHINYEEIQMKYLQVISIENPKTCPKTLEAYLLSSRQKDCLAPISDYKSKNSNEGSQELFCFLVKHFQISEESLEKIKCQGGFLKCP